MKPNLRVITALSLALLLAAPELMAQSGEDLPIDQLLGSWEGPLTMGRDNHTLAFTFAQSEGELQATMTSNGLGIFGMPVDSVRLRGRSFIIRIQRLDLEFTGRVRFREGGREITRIDGDWFQFSEMVPVILERVDAPSF